LRAPRPGREVVTREMIEHAGILRIGEVVRLAPQWNAATVDDFTWRTAPRGFAPGNEDAWILLVDGRPIEAGALGVASLEHLPLDLVAIDSIVFVSSPVLEDGSFAPAGLVHVHTRRPRAGASARGRVAFGSETGDPGPFVFLPGGRANRDRYGHESAAEASIGGGRFYATGSYAASVHLPTDPLILGRMYASSALTPRIERVAPSLRVGTDGAAGGHHLIGGMSRIDDWMRLELAGIEVPVRSTFTHASAAGAVRRSGIDVGYRAGYDRSHVVSKPTAAAPPLDVAWRTLRGTVEVSPASSSGRRIGISIVHLAGSRDAAVAGRETALGAFGEFTARSSATLTHHVAAAATGRGSGVEGGITLTSTAATPAGDFTLRFAGTRARALSPTGLLELTADGMPWLEATGTSTVLPAPEAISRIAGVELGWARGGARSSVAGSAFFRAYGDALVVRRNLEWDPGYRAWRGPVVAGTASGRLAGGHLGMRHRVSGTLDAALNLHLVRAFGAPAFRRAAEPVPVLRSLLALSWRPVAGFGMGAELELESGRRWPDYESVLPAPGKPRASQAGGETLSVSGWKSFLDGRLRGQFTARNLTGRRVILHPEGRASGLAFLFLLGAAL
jgi:hypothetical protein